MTAARRAAASVGRPLGPLGGSSSPDHGAQAAAAGPRENAIEPDGGQPLEAGPDVDLLVNGGDPVPEDDLDDEEDEESLDPATSTVG